MRWTSLSSGHCTARHERDRSRAGESHADTGVSPRTCRKGWQAGEELQPTAPRPPWHACADALAHPDIVDEARLAEPRRDEDTQRPPRFVFGSSERIRLANFEIIHREARRLEFFPPSARGSSDSGSLGDGSGSLQ